MIPKSENESEFLERIQKLEKLQFGGTKESNYSKPVSAREQMIQNEDRETDGEERQHVGADSYETLKQELTALGQTNTPFRDDNWKNRLEQVKTRIVNTELDSNQLQNLTMLIQKVTAGEIEN